MNTSGVRSNIALLSTMLIIACSSSDDSVTGPISKPGNYRLYVVDQMYENGNRQIATNLYSDSGLLIQQNFNRNDVLQEQRFFYYSTDNLLSTREIDRDADGIIDEAASYSYSSSYQLEELRSDSDLDGAEDRRRVYEFDENDRVTGYTQYSIVDGQLGTVSSKTVNTYENGILISIQLDLEPLGIMDFIEVIELAPNGSRLSSTRTDLRPEGDATSVLDYTYEDALCDGIWTNSDFSYFCVNAE